MNDSKLLKAVRTKYKTHFRHKPNHPSYPSAQRQWAVCLACLAGVVYCGHLDCSQDKNDPKMRFIRSGMAE